jgi:hypothetical protein
VALTIVVVVLGGYVTAGALAAPASARRTVGGVVTIRPAAGWVPVGDLGPAAGGARFTRGSGTLDVLTGSAPGDARALAQSYVDGSLDPNSSRLTVTPPTEWGAVPLRGGLTGVRLGYIGVFDQSGVPIEGEVTAVVTAGGSGVVFDGWAPQGQLRFVVDDVHAMVAGASFP